MGGEWEEVGGRELSGCVFFFFSDERPAYGFSACLVGWGGGKGGGGGGGGGSPPLANRKFCLTEADCDLRVQNYFACTFALGALATQGRRL